MSEEYMPYAFIGGGGLVLGLLGLLYLAVRGAEKRLDADALALLRRGATPTQATHQLAARGADLEEAGKAVRRVMEKVVAQGTAADAARMAAAGATADEVKQQLEAKGVPAETAAEVATTAATARWAKAHPVASVVLGSGLFVLGVACFAGAIVIYVGNNTGLFRTFPFAGTIALGLSAIPLVSGWSLLSGRFRKAP